MALQPTLALRQITAALLLMAAFAGDATAKSHAKPHKTVAHKAATRGPAYGKTTEAIALADELAQQYKLPQAWVRDAGLPKCSRNQGTMASTTRGSQGLVAP